MSLPVVRTAHGADLCLAEPDPAVIDIRDIARHLSIIPRFAGAASATLNVASHSIHVALELARLGHPPVVRLWGLLHDAHEAYTGDITRPMIREIVRAAGRDVVRRIQSTIDLAIITRFGLIDLMPEDLETVARADNALLATEWRKWMPGPMPPEIARTEPARIPVEALPSLKAEERFLKMFHHLDVLRGPAPRHAMINFDVHGGT